MKKTLGVFLPLYTTTLLLLLGSGLLTTYVSLRLTSIHVSSALIGAIIAANYIGLVIGGKVGHFLIARVGHIRAYVACAGIITAAVLGHGLTAFIPAWVALRLVIGLCMMCQYMVLESWLNDQAESNQRGMVFGFYMAATYLGMSLGQIVLMLQSNLGITTLLVIALCFALCLVPIALTTRTNARHMSPAPMELRYFVGAIPKVLATTLVIGMVVGSFYGLAPVYASLQSLTTQQTGLFMALAIFAGLIAQFPLSWLSDRYNRPLLMRLNAILLIVAALPLALLPHIDFPLLLAVGFVVSMLQFTLYPAGGGAGQRSDRAGTPRLAGRLSADGVRRRRQHRAIGGRRADRTAGRQYPVRLFRPVRRAAGGPQPHGESGRTAAGAGRAGAPHPAARQPRQLAAVAGAQSDLR
ncbi:Uncharacterized MFS-type transporter ycaD [Serratia marcescens]|uniref:Uncharacterized MFS-type transporter ycaD n=1 Tax=Serratia marcescens TaxID=615 RepID=A0A379Y2B9_SERMA|nr:Uncharacterized MFS-type transporter ycaD [Serratia marcescens]